MSRENTKQQLEYLLADSDSRVIALTGFWGTGKTHLWREVQDESIYPEVQRSLYASLFGLKSVDDIRLKLLEHATANFLNARGRTWNSARSGLKAIQEFVNATDSRFAAISHIPFLAAPQVLKNRVIVLDDIERRGESLKANPILGFIDEISKQYNCRVVLIFDASKLENDEAWQELREKVIDHELGLNVNSRDALDIAKKYIETKHDQILLNSISICEIVNIRIIQKILKVNNAILEPHRDLPDEALKIIVPSIVLLTAAYNRGIPNGLNIEYLLTEKHHDDVRAVLEDNSSLDDKTADWRWMLQRLGVYAIGEFEFAIIDMLQTGLYEKGAVDKYIEKITKSSERNVAENDSKALIESIFWDPDISEDKLIAQLGALRDVAHLIYPSTADYLCKAAGTLGEDGEQAGESFIDHWVDKWRGSPDLSSGHTLPLTSKSMHPLIVKVIDEMEAQRDANVSLVDACVHLAENSGWGPRTEAAIANATETEMKNALLQTDGRAFRAIVTQMIKFADEGERTGEKFKAGVPAFLKSCAMIVNEQSSSRHASIISRVLKDQYFELVEAQNSGEYTYRKMRSS